MGGQDLREYPHDAHLPGDGPGSLLVVAGEQNHVQALLFEGKDGEGSVLFDRVGHGHHAHQLA